MKKFFEAPGFWNGALFVITVRFLVDVVLVMAR